MGRDVKQWSSARLVALLVIAAFGPYVAPGIRTEQLMILAATGYVIFTGKVPAVWRPSHVGLVVTWLALLATSVIGAIGGLGVGSALSGIEALLVPLCLLVTGISLAVRGDGPHAAMVAQKATIVMLALNAALAVVMMNVSLGEAIQPLFWSTGDATATGMYAEQTGRYTGVFNTPLAAGIAYSIGLVALVRLAVIRAVRSSRAWVAAALLLIGGLLAQSKAFLLLGLPVTLGLFLVLNGLRFLHRTVVPTAVIGGVVFYVVSRTEWWTQVGSARLDAYLTAGGGADGLWTLTAGRYGSGADVDRIEADVLRDSPLAGYGVTNSAGPLDTGYVEMLARAGVVGAALAGIFALLLVGLWLSGRRSMSRSQWWTVGALLAVWLGAAMGGPTITQNRAGTILLLNLILVLSTAARAPGQAAIAEMAPPGGVVTPRLRQRSRRRSGT